MLSVKQNKFVTLEIKTNFVQIIIIIRKGFHRIGDLFQLMLCPQLSPPELKEEDESSTHSTCTKLTKATPFTSIKGNKSEEFRIDTTVLQSALQTSILSQKRAPLY
jgi:hypothetical protein